MLNLFCYFHALKHFIKIPQMMFQAWSRFETKKKPFWTQKMKHVGFRRIPEGVVKCQVRLVSQKKVPLFCDVEFWRVCFLWCWNLLFRCVLFSVNCLTNFSCIISRLNSQSQTFPCGLRFNPFCVWCRSTSKKHIFARVLWKNSDLEKFCTIETPIRASSRCPPRGIQVMFWNLQKDWKNFGI